MLLQVINEVLFCPQKVSQATQYFISWDEDHLWWLLSMCCRYFCVQSICSVISLDQSMLKTVDTLKSLKMGVKYCHVSLDFSLFSLSFFFLFFVCVCVAKLTESVRMIIPVILLWKACATAPLSLVKLCTETLQAGQNCLCGQYSCASHFAVKS